MIEGGLNSPNDLQWTVWLQFEESQSRREGGDQRERVAQCIDHALCYGGRRLGRSYAHAMRLICKQINPTDPAARWTAATRNSAFYAYSTNYLIHLDYAVIVDVEATTAIRQAEALAQRRMIKRTPDRFGL